MSLRPPSQTRKYHAINISMTSMVDIVFLLIIFFMLVSSFISAENVRLDLPRPEKSLAQNLDLPERVVLNCKYVAASENTSDGVQYYLGPVRVETLQDLQARLQTARKKKPDCQIVIRADKRVQYKLIRDAMKCVAAAGIRHLNIAAEVED